MNGTVDRGVPTPFGRNTYHEPVRRGAIDPRTSLSITMDEDGTADTARDDDRDRTVGASERTDHERAGRDDRPVRTLTTVIVGGWKTDGDDGS